MRRDSRRRHPNRTHERQVDCDRPLLSLTHGQAAASPALPDSVYEGALARSETAKTRLLHRRLFAFRHLRLLPVPASRKLKLNSALQEIRIADGSEKLLPISKSAWRFWKNNCRAHAHPTQFPSRPRLASRSLGKFTAPALCVILISSRSTLPRITNERRRGSFALR